MPKQVPLCPGLDVQVLNNLPEYFGPLPRVLVVKQLESMLTMVISDIT